MSFRRANESEMTYRLKWAAWEWLYKAAECRAIGFEVRFEGPGGRIADVAGIGPGNALYLIEVKASRADLLRDDHDGEDRLRLEAEGATLRRVADLAQEIADVAPFDHQAALDAALSQRRLALHPERLATFSTKFHDERYLRIADFNYLMTPRRLLRRTEVPPLWGLLDPTPATVVEAPRVGGNRTTAVMAHVTRAIARANSRDMMRGYGVTWNGERGTVFPKTLETSERASRRA